MTAGSMRTLPINLNGQSKSRTPTTRRPPTKTTTTKAKTTKAISIKQRLKTAT